MDLLQDYFQTKGIWIPDLYHWNSTGLRPLPTASLKAYAAWFKWQVHLCDKFKSLAFSWSEYHAQSLPLRFWYYLCSAWIQPMVKITKRWSDRDVSSETCHSLTRSKACWPQRVVIWVTSLLRVFEKVANFERDSPLALVLMLPHSSWWAFVSYPATRLGWSWQYILLDW